MKKSLIAAGLTAGILTLTACNSGDESKVVAETSAGDVTKDEFYQEMKTQSGKQVLRQLITKKVLNDNYDVSDEQVDKEVQKTKDQVGEQFDMFLQQQGFPDEAAYRETIRLSLLQLEAASEGMDITEEDLKQRYERMKTEIEAKHILVDSKEKAKEIKSKLENGGDFAKLAEKNSKDKASAKKGGDLDYFSAGDMVPAFEDKAYSMEVGSVSDPVKSEHGFHIIKVTDKRDTKEDIGSFEDNKETIRRNIINQNINVQSLQQKINKMIQDSDVSIKAEGLEDIFKQQKPGQGQGSGQSGQKSGNGNDSGKKDTSEEGQG
ncbi:foldase protein PrsA [Lentibacillus kapialis]|uniref:Foldase protein PrsA n=1 Tax=Lentibacillus kapialis TaxID=340214 RepID=A0A917PUI8_9BACI|nr:peptidylprolyl isomerase [Lentibacillus kapialis]GGJ92296.1 foldase protein PrsA [Lentibacillus kapialis]